MKIKFVIILSLIFQFVSSQEVKIPSATEKKTYARLDFSIPISINEEDDGPLLNVDGVNGRFGVGSQPLKWIGFGANIGVDWIANESLVAVPFFGTLNLCPKIGTDFRIFIEPGLGKALTIGKNGLTGDFKKISLGIGNEKKDFELYMQVCQYGFSRYNTGKFSSFSFGLRAQLL